MLDSAGTIGIVVLRDSSYQIIGLEKTNIPNDMNNSPITENTGSFSSDNTDYEEGDGDSSLVLENYKEYGISYNSSKNTWVYYGNQIAGLIDNDTIYVDESVGNDLVYLQIIKKSVKEISAEQFNKLINNIN